MDCRLYPTRLPTERRRRPPHGLIRASRPKSGLRFLDLGALSRESLLGLFFRVFDFCPAHELVAGLDAYPREVGNIDPLPNNVADVLKPEVPIITSALDLY